MNTEKTDKKKSNGTCNKPLSGKDILDRFTYDIERIDIPELNGYVHVRGMTGTERHRLESVMLNERGEVDFSKMGIQTLRETVLLSCLCDEAGSCLFSQDDIGLFMERVDSKIVLRLFDKAQELSGMTKEAIETQKKSTEGQNAIG